MPAHRGMQTGQWRAQGIDMGSSSSVASRLLEGGDPVIDQATALLKALANDNRLRILCLLEGQELSVTELNQRLALSQSALSQHLAILRRENLVSTRRASQTIYYSLQGESARTIIDALGRLGLDRVD
jgi:ArsR family transcriptional regulator, virulence genes transcriptional regulator